MLTYQNKFISIDKFIEHAKKMGINLGRGNPNHRIRYYIKIGLLPHQIRIKQSSMLSDLSSTVGHLPTYALALLQKIEFLKSQKKSIDQIQSIISKERLTYEAQTFGQSIQTTKSIQDLLNKFLTFSILILITFAIYNSPIRSDLSLRGNAVNPISIPQNVLKGELLSKPIDQTIQLTNENHKKIIPLSRNATLDQSGNIVSTSDENTGTGTIVAYTTSLQVVAPFVTKESKILITPRSKIGEQTIAVTDIRDGYYFTVEIEKPLSTDINFDWWVID